MRQYGIRLYTKKILMKKISQGRESRLKDYYCYLAVKNFEVRVSLIYLR